MFISVPVFIQFELHVILSCESYCAPAGRTVTCIRICNHTTVDNYLKYENVSIKLFLNKVQNKTVSVHLYLTDNDPTDWMGYVIHTEKVCPIA
jgi:hypothetical protein